MTAHLRLLPPAEQRRNRELWKACLRGQEPAESLSTVEREHLVTLLVARGWSDLDIALHTRMTEYTTARIRRRLELVSSPVSHTPLGRAS